MKRPRYLLPVLLITIFSTVFCSPKVFSQHFLNANVPTRHVDMPIGHVISFDEAAGLFKDDKAIFIDSRPAAKFVLGHIPGAINLNQDHKKTLRSINHFLPENYTIVVYCDDLDCKSSDSLAQSLKKIGITDVKIFPKGWYQWQEKKMPVETVEP